MCQTLMIDSTSLSVTELGQLNVMHTACTDDNNVQIIKHGYWATSPQQQSDSDYEQLYVTDVNIDKIIVVHRWLNDHSLCSR